MPHMEDLDLTFGVEIECVVRVPRRLRLYPANLAVLGGLFDLISGIGIPVVQPGTGVNQNDVDFGAWELSDDFSIRVTEADGTAPLDQYEYLSLELKSRKLMDIPASFQEVRSVLNALHCTPSALNTYANRSCGLHVHVGIFDGEDMEPFPLPMLKRFAQIVVAFELQINCLHAPHRLFDNEARLWCVPPSRMPVFLDKPIMADRMAAILECETTNMLIDLMCHWGNDSAYNLTNLSQGEPSDREFSTIEFRQHAGSVNPERICAWTQFCLALVQFAHQASDACVVRLIVHHASDLTFTVLDLMEVLGLSERVIHLYRAELARE